MGDYDSTFPGRKNKLTFPTLDDSPVWADDFVPPSGPQETAKPKEEETPPLFIIRDHFPRVAKNIELMWGTKEMDAYFDRLIVDDRHGRAGFPPAVMVAILRLSRDHAERFKFDRHVEKRDTRWGTDRNSQ